jgi:uncharacterized protein YyaL (SSP411 family)
MSAAQNSTHENRLARETSPYLLQHKHNPVDWWPWGPEALAEAKRTERPILLSVGYAACHWCHVMAHESFEDEATAAVMNALFVNIKVDREERPDIDQIYMSALHHLGEHGGWPLTMFLTPDGEPVWGGTYFPKESRFGKPNFVHVLQEISRLFRDDPERINNNRQALMNRLAEKARPAGKVTIGAQELDEAARQIAGAMDPIHGGIRGAPKFPNPSILEFLWRAGLRMNDARFFRLVELTLERMAQGGIYDHVGGGYSRYSVDDKWLVPHFEKMLYDNAQILELLALAYQHSGNSLFRARARETVEWLDREMTTHGAFAASLDADSEGEEGKFYVWSLDEINQLLGLDADLFVRHYGVSAEGNFEGHNILNRMARVAASDEDEAKLKQLRTKLLAAREARVRPGFDDKILADWNGLMIAALVNAGVVFEEPLWIDMAGRAFAFIADSMTRGDRLGHSWRNQRLLFPGLASDFAAMIKAGLALYEATGERSYLDRAISWQQAFDRHYAAPTGGYYLTADDAEGLVIRPDATTDDATPNPNGVAAQNLLRLAVFDRAAQWRKRADHLFDGLLPLAAQNMFAHTSLLSALDTRLHAAEIVVTGAGERAAELLLAALKLPFIERFVLRAPNAAALPEHHPARQKLAAAPAGTAFICMAERCSLPVSEPEKIVEAVAAMRA